MTTTYDETPLLMADSAKECLEWSDKILERTGCYSGIRSLDAKQADPLAYESLHTQLRAAVIQAKEMARRVTASSAVREEGEFVVTLYTLEGDAIVLSTGIMLHVHTTSRFIKWMIANDYERDPGIMPGDIFSNNDPFIGDVHPADVMDVMPLFSDGNQIGWVGAVSHVPDVGGVEPGGECGMLADRFGEGLFVSAEKIGSNGALHRTHLIRLERNLRKPVYWILDEKAKVGACLEVAAKVAEIIEKYGLEYYLRATRELIEENRRGHLERVRTMMVPGRYRGVTHYTSLLKDQTGVVPEARHDLLYALPLEMTIDAKGIMRLDFEGTPEPGPHTANCTEAAMDGGLFITLTQLMDFDKANHGAWLSTDLVLPEGTLVNPLDEKCATSTAWGVLIPAFALFQRLCSRGFFSRGFREEVFLGGGATPFQEAGGFDHYGERFGAGNFEDAACSSGARGIMDGIDVGYTGWNPEGDMGSIEQWELEFPFLYLGRRNLIDSGGSGKYRGGVYFAPVVKVHRSDRVSIATKESPGRAFDNGGIFGGYPAANAHRHYAIRANDLQERIANRQPLPHGITETGETVDILEQVAGEVEVVQGHYATSLFKHDDVYAHMYSSGGGYGDPLERDPSGVAKDVQDGKVSRRAAETVYGAVFGEVGLDSYSIDVDATEQRRQDLRDSRRSRAVPVRDWIDSERARVEAGRFIDPVKEMYRSVGRVSPKFAEDYGQFWSLKAPWEGWE